MADLPPEAYRFEGFGPHTVAYFTGLEQDNSKPYFERNRELWETEIREPMEALLMEAAVHFDGRVKLFRPYRDIRFSKDKSPYKTATFGVVYPENSGGALFAGISARGLFAGAGYHGIASDQIDRFREAVADDRTGSQLAEIVARAELNGLAIEGEALKSAPRGYAKDHPRIRFLRMKEIYAGAHVFPGPQLHDRRALDLAMATWRTTQPLLEWLDRNVGPSQMPHDGRMR